MLHLTEDDPQVSYWPSVSDLFMTMFIIALVMVAAMNYLLIPHNQAAEKNVIDAVGLDAGHIREPVNRMRAALEVEWLPQLRNTQPADEIVKGLAKTADEVVHQISVLRKPDRGLEPGKVSERVNQMRAVLTNCVPLTLSSNSREILDGLGDTSDRVVKEITMLRENTETLRRALAEKDQSISDTVAEWQRKYNEAQKLNEERVVHINEATKEYRFASGSAVMNSAFKSGLHQKEFTKLAKEILSRNRAAATAVNTLEIIGHTDGEPVSSRGNLDEQLPTYLAKVDHDLGRLTAGSNNDLGLLRALAVRQAWMEFVENQPEASLLRTIRVRCYSAGQTSPEGDNLVDSDPNTYRRSEEKFRRIEMRMTRLLR